MDHKIQIALGVSMLAIGQSVNGELSALLTIAGGTMLVSGLVVNFVLWALKDKELK